MLLCLQRHAGFIIGIFAVPWLVYTIYNLNLALNRPRQRLWRVIRFLAWGICILVALGVHKKYEVDAHAEAAKMIDVVKTYKQQHGRYPENMKQAGLGSYDAWPVSRAHYAVTKDGPVVLYKNTWSPELSIWYYFEPNTPAK